MNESADKLDRLSEVRATLESFMQSMDAKKKKASMPHLKEALRALANEKPSSPRATYMAAHFVRKAYASNWTALPESKEEALRSAREMANEEVVLKALGYGFDTEHPSYLDGTKKLPPLVKLKNMTLRKADEDPSN